MDIQIKLHTLIVGVGPKQCGKTFFFKQKFLPMITNAISQNNKLFRPNIKFISSEEIRRWLLNDTENVYDKDSERMNNVSESCFNILNIQVNESLRTGAHIVIVDTTGMNDNFRTDMKNIAMKYNYNIIYCVFDYKNRSDYYENTSDKFTMSKNIDRFKKILNEFDKNNSIKIKYLLNNNTNLNISIINFDTYLSRFLPTKKQFVVFVHCTKYNVDIVMKKIKQKSNYDLIFISDELEINNINNMNELNDTNKFNIYFLKKGDDPFIFNPEDNDIHSIPITISYTDPSKGHNLYYTIGYKINKINKIVHDKQPDDQINQQVNEQQINNTTEQNSDPTIDYKTDLFDNLDEIKKIV